MQAGADLSSAAGLRAHAQLTLIMDEIVNSVYGIASTGLNYPQTLTRADTALHKLSSWKTELPSSLRAQNNGKFSDRASLVLHMIYNQVYCSSFSRLLSTDLRSIAHNPLHSTLFIPSIQAISRSKIPPNTSPPAELEYLPCRSLHFCGAGDHKVDTASPCR
jgi:hypothetical protein